MSTIDSTRQPDSDNLLRALIEEARQRARRRRRAYGGVLALALIGAIVFATLQGPARSGSGSPAALAGPGSPASATPVSRAMPAEHVANGVFICQGKLGPMRIYLRLASSSIGTYWKLWGYHLARGSGQRIAIGRLEGRWYGRLSGSVTPTGGPKQRVLIKLKGRGKGTFEFIPAQPGVLKRDSGTCTSWFIG